MSKQSTLICPPIDRFDVDIFCKVIDNFGDIGVAWRLARQLQEEHQQNVRLWLDNLSALICLCPAGVSQREEQNYLGINIRVWYPDRFPTDIIPARLVIETFGCPIPTPYRLRMKDTSSRWINLEYFSAEDWVVDCHLMPSLQADGLQKSFFMPSIRSHTGGLLREKTLIQQRDAFQQDPQQQANWLKRHQIPTTSEASFKISLFSYENQHIHSLITQLTQAICPVTLYVPHSKSLNSLNQALAKERSTPLYIGDSYQQGQLTLHVLPFLPQTDYDPLLWWCDLNFVRGEDSLVRAIWAGKPFIWQIYPTEDNAHWDKLNAFLQHYYATSSPAEETMKRAHRIWNTPNDDTQALKTLFKQLLTAREASDIQQQSRIATNRQLAYPSLVEQLVKLIKCSTS